MPNNMIYSFDLKQAEWVVCAYYAKEINMIRTIESGRDIHVSTANLISGIPDEIIIKESKIVGQESNPDIIEELRRTKVPEIFDEDWYMPRLMSLRQMGKKSNHGLNLDEGAERFAQEYEMEYSEARRIYAGYHAAYPGIQNTFHQSIQDQLRKDRTITNCWGERRQFLDLWCRELFKAAYAFIPQSTVVHITDRAMQLCYDDTARFMQPLELLTEVHDNLKYQYPAGVWEDAARMVMKVVEYMSPQLEYWGRRFKIGVELKVGLNFSKMVEIKYNKEKNLAKALSGAWRELNAQAAAG